VPVTPTFSLPYELGSATPNGAAQGQALAVAAEAALVGVKASVTALEGAGGMVPRIGAANSNQGISGTADITGTVLSFTTIHANVPVLIWAVFDVTTDGTFEGTIQIDGTGALPNAAHLIPVAGAPVFRASVAAVGTAVLAAPGSHSIRLRGVRLSGSTAIINQTHTTITALQLAT